MTDAICKYCKHYEELHEESDVEIGQGICSQGHTRNLVLATGTCGEFN